MSKQISQCTSSFNANEVSQNFSYTAFTDYLISFIHLDSLSPKSLVRRWAEPSPAPTSHGTLLHWLANLLSVEINIKRLVWVTGQTPLVWAKWEHRVFILQRHKDPVSYGQSGFAKRLSIETISKNIWSKILSVALFWSFYCSGQIGRWHLFDHPLF